MTNQAKGHYRPDIDGFRSLAVLSVVLFHIDPSWVPGGFVGVDIFFVISGYLITGIILRSMESGSFSLREFYRRRIKRIVPALSFVIACTVLAGQFILLPEDLSRLANSALASQFFFANVYFTYFLDVSYFASDASLEPLLHLWSLGVEEQYYLFWPILLGLWISRFGKRGLVSAMVVVAIGSFLLGEVILTQDPMFAYYMLPTRAGELLAGAACALLLAEVPGLVRSRRREEWLSWIGMLLVIWSLFRLSEDNGFPGINAIPVTVGSAFILASGSTGRTLFSRLFSLRPLVGIGLISYSMYLWHWPLLAYMKYLDPVLSLWEKLAAFVLTLSLAIISYRMVEVPFRKSVKDFRGIVATHFALPSAAIFLVCMALLLSNGYGLYQFNGAYKSEYTTRLENLNPAYKYEFICQSYRVTQEMLRDERCVIGGSGEPNALLWGDSNGSYYVGALGELAEKYGFSFRNIAHSSCPPLLKDQHLFVKETLVENCQFSGNQVAGVLDDYKVIFMAGAWNTYLRKQQANAFSIVLEDTVKRLRDRGHVVVLLGRVPAIASFDRECKLKQLKVHDLDCEGHMQAERSAVDRINGRIRSIAQKTGVYYYDVNDSLCDQGQCSALVEGQLAYHDPGHLSMAGSVLVGQLERTSKKTEELFRIVGDTAKSTLQSPLPWQRPSFRAEKQITLTEVHEIDTKRFMNPDNWLGIKPKSLAHEGTLFLEDSDAASYQVSSLDLRKLLDPEVELFGTQRYLVLTALLEKAGLTYPLFRFRSPKDFGRSHDVIVDGPTGALKRRGLVGDIHAEIRNQGNNYIIAFQIPLWLVRDGLRLDLFPAASGPDMSYSKDSIGQLNLLWSRAGIAQPVGENGHLSVGMTNEQ